MIRLIVTIALFLIPYTSLAYNTEYTLHTSTGNFALKIEIAKTDKERAKGLMFRKNLELNHGMLFDFSKTDRYSFWMKNTSLPLDLITFDSSLKVIETVKNLKPFSEDIIHPQHSYKYALELKAGSINRLNIKPGDRLKIQ